MPESPIHLKTPLKTEDLTPLHIGDRVLLSGTIYTGRDAAHHRLVELIDNGESLPLDLKGQVIYYVGPTPPKPGQALGAAGPTSSYRMDAYTPALLEKGLKGMIGKGARDQSVKEGIKKYKAVYFAAIDGVKFLKPVVPGDQLRMRMEALRMGSRFWKMKGEAFVDEAQVAKAEIMGALR